MKTRKVRRSRTVPVPSNNCQTATTLDFANLSAIEKASFMEGLQNTYGKPFHSTVLEEDVAMEKAQLSREVDGKNTQHSIKGVKNRPEQKPKAKTSKRKQIDSCSGSSNDAESHESPKKSNLGRSPKCFSEKPNPRKSSSGQNRGDKHRKKRPSSGSELDVFLEAFLDFSEQYRDSMECPAVKKSIEFFSDHVEKQILEMISFNQKLRTLKRENGKTGSLITTHSQRLLDAKVELKRAERELWQLQREQNSLQVKLTDLQRSRSYLHDIRKLNEAYLDHCHKHPMEEQTYGASSLPALLLEAKSIQQAKVQMREINDQLEKHLEME